jgi:hypothetical protein
MTKRDDGGPAFARPIGEYKEVGAGKWSEHQQGMSLRDYFAGASLPALIENCVSDDRTVPYVEHVSALAYRMADAMLAERAK